MRVRLSTQTVVTGSSPHACRPGHPCATDDMTMRRKGSARRRQVATIGVLLVIMTTRSGLAATGAPTIDADIAGRFARLALDCVQREYPNKISHVLTGDADARPPRELTPAFFGCFDWHSSVHGHWLLARLSRLVPNADFTADARGALARSLTPRNIEVEVAYLSTEGRATFERPYGLAWLLQLAAELREWDDVEAQRWLSALIPMETVAARHVRDWLPNLSHPIRVGEHSQTAFAFGVVLDWARIANDTEMERLLRSRIGDYYLSDRACPLAYEPSGQDFLSPCLAEADLVRRVLTTEAFATWLDQFLPEIPRRSGRPSAWLTPAVVTDPTDGKLAHLDGLNLSRAWMLEGIVSGLPPDDPRRGALEESAQHHRDAGLASVTGVHYEGGHWLASFATYLVTQRGR